MLKWISNLLRRSIFDNPNLDLRNPAVWEEAFGGQYTASSGEAVTLLRAMGYPALRQGVTLLSGDVAKLPFTPHRVRADGSTEVDKSHPAYKVCAWYPNEAMSAFTFWRHMMIHAVIYTHAYAYIDRNGRGDVVGMVPLLTDRTIKRQDGDGYLSEIDGEIIPIPEYKIFHLRGMCIGDGDDCSMLHDCRNAIGLGLAANNFASRFFKNGGRMGGVLEIPAAMTDKAKSALQEGFRKTYENKDSQFTTVILRDNAKFHSASFAPEQSQMTQSREEQVKETARLLNIPIHKLGVDGRTAYNSLEMEERAYINNSLSHWFKAIAGEANIKLLRANERERMTHCFKHDISELIATDSETRARVGRTEIEMGALSPNEYRAQRGLPPREGGDVFLVPLNMTTNVEDDVEGEATTQVNETDDVAKKRDLVEAIQKIYLGVGRVLSPAEAREILNRNHNANLTGDFQPWNPAALGAPGEPEQQPQPEPEQDEQAAAAARGRAAIASLVVREVKRKDAQRFCAWFDDQFPEGFPELRERISQILDTTTEDTLRQDVIAAVQDWRIKCDDALTTAT